MMLMYIFPKRTVKKNRLEKRRNIAELKIKAICNDAERYFMSRI